jgi:hypothetical protein
MNMSQPDQVELWRSVLNGIPANCWQLGVKTFTKRMKDDLELMQLSLKAKPKFKYS